MFVKTNIVLSLNFLFSPILLLILVFSSNENLASYFGLTSAFIIFVTQSLSANKRQIIILSKNFLLLKRTFIERILFSIIILSFCFLYFFFFYLKDHSLILFVFSIFICIFWIQEILLTELEQKQKKKIIFSEFLLYVSFYLSIFYYFFLGKENFNILIILNIFLIAFFLIFINKLSKIEKDTFALNQIKRDFFFDLLYFSSFSIIFCNFLWRVMIYYFCGDSKAGMLYAAFSLGSLPSTLFVNIFGTNLIKTKINKKRIFTYFFLYVFFVLTILVFINSELLNKFFYFDTFFLTAVKYSILGSIFMLCGQYIRKILIMKNIKLKIKDIFVHDIIYSVLLLMVVPISYYLGAETLLVKSFLAGSVLCFLYYFIINLNKKFDDKK